MSAGAEKADLWVPIRPGSDAAAALAMAYVLIHELDLIDRDYLVERTNAPALVDPATQRVLRAEGSNKSLYWDEAANAAKPYDECEKPALEGEYEVDGVKCHTAFSVFKEHIREMTPEWAEEITTVPAATLRQVAEEFGAAARIGETIEIEGKTYRRRGAAVDIFSGLSRHKHSILNVWACLQLKHPHRQPRTPWRASSGFATKCHGWADDNPTAGFDLNIWEEDGFIECNSLMIGAPNSFYKIIRERDCTPTTQGLLELQPLSEDGHFVHMAMADPDLYHTKRPRNLFWYACNPIKWWANVEEQVKVYQDMDFIAGVDIYLNDMSYFSDIMLPEACYLERYDVLPQFYMNHRMIGSLDTPWTLAMWQPVVEPKDGRPRLHGDLRRDRRPRRRQRVLHSGGLRPVPREGGVHAPHGPEAGRGAVHRRGVQVEHRRGARPAVVQGQRRRVHLPAQGGRDVHLGRRDARAASPSTGTSCSRPRRRWRPRWPSWTSPGRPTTTSRCPSGALAWSSTPTTPPMTSSPCTTPTPPTPTPGRCRTPGSTR